MSGEKSEAYDATLLADSGPRPTPRPSDAALERWLGAHFDHFKIERAIAKGGMGAVYLAHDTSLDRRVAIKVLPDELASHSLLHERFVREARAQARLNSPHVVHIYYIGRTPEVAAGRRSLYFAMELVEGGSLEQGIDRGELLEPERARRLMIQVARGLRDASGIIHRDIKPSNLLLDKNGYVKIADFGVAKPVDAKDTSITQEGSVVGSPLYMAPEQARGEDVDQRADMYALGAAFHHLLCGKPPFDGPTPLAVIARHLADAPPSLAALVPTLPKELAAVVARLLQKAPSDRYADYDALIAALEAAAPESVARAGFFVRGAAVGIDVVVASVVIGLIGWPGMVLHLLYVTSAHALRGQTLGKYLLNLKVRCVDGSPLGWGRSLARTFAALWLPFFAGIMTLLTEGRHTLRLTVEQMNAVQLDAFQSFVLAIAIGNALLTLLYVAGMALAIFHPQKKAAHDLIVGSEVVYALKRR